MMSPDNGNADNVSHDFVAPGFEGVAAAFFATIEDGRSSGSAVSVWKDGVPVVSLAGGVANPATGKAFTTDTLIPVASVTKGLASLLVARLVERRALPSYDTPIREVWPEFDAYGKGEVSIGDVLAHRAGLSAPRKQMTLDEIFDALATADVLAAQEPLWQPGSSHQYHAFTHGGLTAKIVADAYGKSLGTMFADEVTRPLNADAWIGLPTHLHSAVAPLQPDRHPAPADTEEGQVNEWVERAVDLGSGQNIVEMVYQPRGLSAELPGVNGIGSATAIAKIWSAAVTPTDGVRLISEDTARALRRPRSVGAPEYSGPPPYQSWGAGVMIPSHWEWYLTGDSFGHDGAHGQVAFADPYFNVGFAYLTNQIGDWERGQSVVAALSRALSRL